MAKTKKTKATRTRVGGKTVETIQHTGATMSQTAVYDTC